jgi:N-methylhydantoinase A
VRPKPALSADGHGGNGPRPEAEPTSRRSAFFGAQAVETPVYTGDQLVTGMRVEGPAIIEETTTTIVLVPGSRAVVRPSHYLVEIVSEPIGDR